MLIYAKDIDYSELPLPAQEEPQVPDDLSGEIYFERRDRLCAAMQKEELDALILYADREHGGNFGFITGFEPRFEEACLVLHASGKAWVLLGNECLKMHAYSRVPVTPVHVPYFSLPNQPMTGEARMADHLRAAELGKGMRVGLIGWKWFTGRLCDASQMYDIPHFIVQAVQEAVGSEGRLCNAAHMMYSPENGLRTAYGAEEIVQFEYAASLASLCVGRVLEEVAPGKTEMQLAQHLCAYSQPLSCYSMCATGERFTNAVVFPRNKAVQTGDKFTVSMGLRGGLTCRAGYIAKTQDDLPAGVRGYIEQLAMPYFAASATWYSTLAPGVTGGEIYKAVDTVFPKAEFGWQLNPGHLTAAEEWLSSPIEKDSPIALRSGMLLQMDIIPKLAPFGGVSAEDGVVIADEELRAELRERFPQAWARMQRRRDHMTLVLGIPLHESVLPLSDSVGDLRPLLLDRRRALCVRP